MAFTGVSPHLGVPPPVVSLGAFADDQENDVAPSCISPRAADPKRMIWSARIFSNTCSTALSSCSADGLPVIMVVSSGLTGCRPLSCPDHMVGAIQRRRYAGE